MNKNTARRAAKWWTSFLKEGSKLDQGDSSEAGLFAKALGSSLQRSLMRQYTLEKIQAFEDALCDGLINQQQFKRVIITGVDYYPDKILQDAADIAGIKVDSVLPWKTHMYIDGEEIKVSYGYGAPLRKI